jgi:hypothetical protein
LTENKHAPVKCRFAGLRMASGSSFTKTQNKKTQKLKNQLIYESPTRSQLLNSSI